MVKRLFCLFLTFLTFLIGLTFAPAAVYAQQASGPITFSQQELDQLLAPIALYPDPLLSQVLMAATYPLEAVQAARFVRQNPSLKGDALARALEGEPWDASVKALLQFPAVLAMMDDQLAWTQKLGDAFLAQQDAVMDTVQSLRAKAQAAGTLGSNQQQHVVIQDGAIDIEPNAPDVIYVPYYNPTVVYGGWWWPDYPPMMWAPPPGYQPLIYDSGIGAAIAFGIGVGIINSIFNDTIPDWRRHHFVRNKGPADSRSRGSGDIWTHNPAHRLGVAYRDVATRNRFQPSLTNNVNREAYRGHVSGVAPAPQPLTGVARPGVPIRSLNVRPVLPAGSPPQPGTVGQPHTPSSASQPRVEIPLPAHPVMRPPVEQVHPFIPAGPASVIQSHAERGRTSREESGFNQAGSPAAPQNRLDNQARPPAAGATHDQQRQPSR